MRTTQPRKQRKMLYEMPAHARTTLFSAPLSPSLKTSHHVNAVPVRTGDTVRIMRGDKRGSEGKVSRVDRSKYRIFVDGVTREKVDGTPSPIPIHPSKVMITSLSLDDKWRQEILKIEAKEAEKPVEKEKPEKPKKQRRARKPREKAPEKVKAPRKRREKRTEEGEKAGGAESG